MSNTINNAALSIQEVFFYDFEITKALTDEDLTKSWTYTYNVEFYKQQDEDDAERDSIECTTVIKCTDEHQAPIYEIEASSTFSLKRLTLSEVDEDLWLYLVETSYRHIEGYFYYHTKDTILKSKNLPYINFKDSNNFDINKQLTGLWG